MDAYRELKPTRVEMILRALDEALWTPKSEKLTIHGSLTIEHVMPQSWQDNWPLPMDVNVETATEAREEAIHDFGNLTLLTQPLNSSVGNAGPGTKLPAIALQSSLRLNRYFQGRMSWSEDDIRERGESLFEVACRVWPRPS